MRTNVYKEQILAVLKKSHLLTIAHIHKALPDADYSTVFRNIEQLLAEQKIRRIMIDNKSIAYESAHESHDHFICNHCGAIEEITLPHTAIDGRTIDDITVRGNCTNCK